jgi:hypothetical protein
MGIAYLMWIYDDALDQVTPDSPDWAKSCVELGEAVLRLTHDVGYFAGAGPKRRTAHALGHTAKAVNYCDEAHSADQRVYLWSGNRLCRLSRAGDDEVVFAEEELAQEKLVREKRRQPAS